MTVTKNRMWRVVLVVLVLLVAFRLTLPYIVTRYVNNILNDLEGYRGSASDVDIDLYRGAYQIDSIRIFKLSQNQEIPFLEIPLTDLSIEWSAVLNGAFVGDVAFENATLHLLAEEKSDSVLVADNSAVRTGRLSSVNWIEKIKRLMPVEINRLRVRDGKVIFTDPSTTPGVAMFLNNVQLDALNLTNAKDNPEPLPSRIYMQALSIGNGQLNVAMKANVMKEVPDVDMDLRFERVNLRALADFFEAYANMEVQQGEFNMYSEVSVIDGNISGYVKPLFQELQVSQDKPHDNSAHQILWDSMVNFLTDAIENQKTNEFATRVPVTGQISSVDHAFWPALWNIFSTAFVEAFDQNTASLSAGSATTSSESKVEESKIIAAETKSEKELRKEKRRQKREERRRAKKEKKHKDDSTAIKPVTTTDYK
jgi:hypothetical protein